MGPLQGEINKFLSHLAVQEVAGSDGVQAGVGTNIAADSPNSEGGPRGIKGSNSSRTEPSKTGGSKAGSKRKAGGKGVEEEEEGGSQTAKGVSSSGVKGEVVQLGGSGRKYAVLDEWKSERRVSLMEMYEVRGCHFCMVVTGNKAMHRLTAYHII